jgi:glycerophosphoryl diester phosphodiesterase
VPAVFPGRGPWLSSAFTLAEIQRLDGGSWFVDTDPFGTIAKGVVTSAEQQAYRGEPIPTLREALLFTREHHWRVNVEIKALLAPLQHFPIVAQVVRLIETLGLVDQVLLSSFEHAYLRQAKQLNPHLAVAALIDEDDPWPVELSYDALHPYVGSVGVENTQLVRQAGLAVNPWPVNDPAEMQRLIQAGVSGMFTDFPQTLRQVVG